MGFQKQEYWPGLPFPLPVDHVLSELSTMTCPSWVALHGMVHSFIQLHKPFHYDKAVITLLTKVLIVKAMVFPVVMYRCESCTIKKTECQRIDAFETWFQRRCLRVPWTARKSIQSILREINPEYSLKGLMLKLKLQYFGHLLRRADSL